MQGLSTKKYGPMKKGGSSHGGKLDGVRGLPNGTGARCSQCACVCGFICCVCNSVAIRADGSRPTTGAGAIAEVDVGHVFVSLGGGSETPHTDAGRVQLRFGRFMSVARASTANSDT